MESGAPTPKLLLDGAARFLSWWRDELWELAPQPVRRLLADAQPDVVLIQLEDGFQVLEVGASRPGQSASASPVLSRAHALAKLAAMAEAGTARIVGVRLPLTRCFARRVELPRAARKDLREILNLDLERATPFKLSDVYTAYVVEDEASTKGKLQLRQLVVKREVLDPLIADVQATDLEVAFVDCWRDEPQLGLPIDFLERGVEAGTGSSGLVTLPRALAALVLLLTVAAIVLTLSRYETALAEVQAQTAKMRTQAAAVRSVLERSDAAVGDLARLQQTKLKQIPAIEVVEEITRLLPDSVWLAELRIEGDTVDVTGLAPSGAALPPLFERSAMFADAALTAPLTLDPREDKERFTLRARIRQPADARQLAPSERRQ